jgi:SAM-dependent methyltransferase
MGFAPQPGCWETARIRLVGFDGQRERSMKIQKVLRDGLVLCAVLGLSGCGGGGGEYNGTNPGTGEFQTNPGTGEFQTNPGTGEFQTNPGTGEFRYSDPRAVTVPTIVAAPLLDPIREFPSEPEWNFYYFQIDSPARNRGEVSLPIDRWVNASPGQAIADVGAGGGYYTFRYAPRVAPSGFIQAVDIDWHSTQKIAWEAKQRETINVLVTQVPDGELGLEEQRFDTVLMISTGILLTCNQERAQSYLSQVARSLRPGGQLIYLDPLDRTALPGVPACPETSGISVFERAAPYFDVEERVDMPGMMGGSPSMAVRFRLRETR